MSHVHHIASAVPFEVETCKDIAACKRVKHTVLERIQQKKTKKVQTAGDKAKKTDTQLKICKQNSTPRSRMLLLVTQ